MEYENRIIHIIFICNKMKRLRGLNESLRNHREILLLTFLTFQSFSRQGRRIRNGVVGEVGHNVAILNLVQSGMDIKNKGRLLQGIT